MTFRSVVAKEVLDVLREKRFGGWAIAFGVFWTVVLVVYLLDMRQRMVYGAEYPMSVFELVPVLYYVGAISLVVLALFLASDGLAKERESGMLPLVGATPVVRWHLLAAKVVGAYAAYAGAFLVALLPLGVVAAAQGTPVLLVALSLYGVPFLALWTFLVGSGLLLGVALKSSKVAIGAGAGIYFPIFLLGGLSPFEGLFRQYPLAKTIASYTPFDASYKASFALAFGGTIPWGPLGVTVALGVAFGAAAFAIFARQEVA